MGNLTIQSRASQRRIEKTGTQRGVGHLLKEAAGLEACRESPQLTVQS